MVKDLLAQLSELLNSPVCVPTWLNDIFAFTNQMVPLSFVALGITAFGVGVGCTVKCLHDRKNPDPEIVAAAGGPGLFMWTAVFGVAMMALGTIGPQYLPFLFA